MWYVSPMLHQRQTIDSDFDSRYHVLICYKINFILTDLLIAIGSDQQELESEEWQDFMNKGPNLCNWDFNIHICYQGISSQCHRTLVFIIMRLPKQSVSTRHEIFVRLLNGVSENQAVIQILSSECHPSRRIAKTSDPALKYMSCDGPNQLFEIS